MAYQIDYSESIWIRRRRRKASIRLLFAAAVAGLAWGVHYVYVTYNQPTLNMKLAEYEAVARPIEEMNAAWDESAREYGALLRYYRLLWAANPTNFLCAMASPDAPRMGRGFHPLRWKLTTGGECRLDYAYEFAPGDKASQAKGIEGEIVNAVTSVVSAAGGKVDVQGVQHENLLRVETLDITAVFSLPDARTFPVKERMLADCVQEIAAMRKKVQETRIADGNGVKGAPTDARGIMMAYLPIGRDKPDFPNLANAIDVAGWMSRADQFILKNKIPGNDAERRGLRESWNHIGDARFPWDRFRTLDNDELVDRTKVLGTVSDGVKRFKGFLEQRHEDCIRKLEPFIEAYDRNDVFNKPLVESDLRDRVAKASGIVRAIVSFKDEPSVEPAVLTKADEKFTFTWVRWTLDVGGEAGSRDQGAGNGEQGARSEPITLAKLADCVRRALELGPGYALDAVDATFAENGDVLSARIEGLLPVKKVESVKEAEGNAN